MKTVLYIHGKGGNASESTHYENLFPDCKVIGLDYKTFSPWETGKEIHDAVVSLKTEFESIILIANSIGAFFCMNANLNSLIEKAYFISPVVNMEKLICDMMKWANVTEAELEQRKIIPTDFGEELSWEYLCYVREHSLNWQVPTSIIYGEKDNLTSIETMRAFAEKQGASLTVMKGGEHWFHTEEEMKFLDEWIGRQK
ncbi:alpha/beta fold hydrolase [Treponema porcinum]|uniref:alpha/beta fold hydrolase n=1 Tax=Treponema porcinum TaxID=261392 RepID=UPI002352304C|nr:alpha/beta hydrolase [Treponema porcinum]MCI6482421.1 alpha/beta hydrolase [Treponema porcinum]